MKIKERLKRLENQMHKLHKDFIQASGPGRVECPKCGKVKNIGNVVICPSGTFTLCNGCGETLRVATTIVGDENIEV